MTTPLTFRKADSGDVDAIVALVESAYRGDVSRQGWTTEADLLDGRRTGADDVAACLQRPRSRIVLAERDGVLLDPTYTAKAMAGLIALVQARAFAPDQTVLFWHTGGQVGLFA